MKVERMETMVTYCNSLHFLWRDDAGQDLIEYALVASLIGLAAVTSLKTVATTIGSEFQNISSAMTSAIA